MNDNYIGQTPESPDPLLDEILDDSEEISFEDKPLREAKKFLSLMEEFDIKEGSNMEENLLKEKNKILNTKKELGENVDIKQLEQLEISIVDSEELLSDFILVRETLREDIRNTRVVLGKLSEDLGSLSADELNGQVVMAFSDIKKSNVLSMKLLMESYSTVAETQLKVKKLAMELKTESERENQSEDGNTNIQNAVFVGSTAELLKSLKG